MRFPWKLYLLWTLVLLKVGLIAQDETPEPQPLPRWAIMPPNVNEDAVKGIILAQLKTIQAGDLTKAYFTYTSPDFQNATSLEEFKEFVHRFSVLSDNKSIELPTRILKENSITYRGTLTSKDGKVLGVEYQMIKIDDRWMIQEIKLHPMS